MVAVVFVGVISKVCKEHRKTAIAFAIAVFLLQEALGLERPAREAGNEHAGGMFIRPWESPCASERTQYGCGQMCICFRIVSKGHR